METFFETLQSVNKARYGSRLNKILLTLKSQYIHIIINIYFLCYWLLCHFWFSRDIYIYMYILLLLLLYIFTIGPDEVLLKIIFVSLIHINALNRMEINLLSSCDRILFFSLDYIICYVHLFTLSSLPEILKFSKCEYFICPDGIVSYSGFTGVNNA